MKFPLLLTLYIALSSLAAGQQGEQRVTWNYEGSTFEEFVSQAEAHLQIRFYYKNEWTEGLRMPDSGKEPLLSDLLRRLFAGKAIYYFVDEPGNVIITKDFAVKSFASGTIPSENLLPRQDRSEDKERTAVSEYLIYEIGNPAEKARQGNVSITGYIRDKNSGEPLRGVTVFISELAGHRH